MPRGSQRDRDIRVFSFKLDRRDPDQAHARRQLEDAMDADKDLREMIVDWLHGEDKIVIVEDTSVEDQVARALEGFEKRLFKLLLQTAPEDIQRYADERKSSDELDGVKLTEDFVSNMMRGFNR